MSYPIQFLLILLLTVLGCVKVTIQGDGCRKYVSGMRDSTGFNAVFFASAALFLFLIFRPGYFTRYTFLFGSLIVVATFIFQNTYSIALTVGPVSLTVMLVNFNVLISTLVSTIRYHENVSVYQIIGILFLLLSLVLTVKEDDSGKKGSGKWLILTLAAMVFSGISNALQKIYSMEFASLGGDSSISVLVVLYSGAAAISFITCLLQKKPDGKPFPIKLAPYAIAVGAVMCGFQKLFVFELEKIDGIFLFPTYAGMNLVLMTVIGIIRFRDRLTIRQLCGVACGFISVLLMNLR